MLSNKVAVVTGAARGIGKAIALKMAENGADVVLLDVAPLEQGDASAEEIRATGRKAVYKQCDVTDFDSTKEVVNAIIKEMGGIDILVNNAGITKDKVVLAMKEADFDAVLNVNLKGVFHMIKHCYSHFMKKKAGKIINISSVAGLIGNPGQANYAASKAGILGLTKSVARELASRGVCCNAIAPGFIQTDMTAGLDMEDKLESMIPMGHMGEPDDIAELAVFLASDKANYITGEVIRVDGGTAM
ncbi:MAG: 3-oxoacyl-[acyl-carrier-protein] reductase [Bacillota bacterium]|nr:3-oxoacyl-[acyl-carrier-protein] reductase [Bacillota bacterium]